MFYLILKYIHIVSSTILFGTGIGTAAVMLYGHFQKNPEVKAAINEYVVKVDWFFTGISAFVQLITGFWMVHIAHFSLSTAWLFYGIIGYIIAGTCWFYVVYLQIKIRNLTIHAAHSHTPLPSSYTTYFKQWLVLGWIAFSSLLGVFYVMVVKVFW